MKFALVVACWGREAVTQLCLTRFARAARGHDVLLVAATDEVGNGSMAVELGYEVVSVPNAPLSDKHNAMAAHIRGRVDAMVLVGSDDWICDRLFGVWAGELERSPVVGVVDSWQVCTHRRAALFYAGYTTPTRVGESIGTARALRSDVLDAVDWRPWPDGLSRGLDGGMTARLRWLGYDTRGRAQASLGVRVLGLKGEDALTPFERFERLPGMTAVSRDAALDPFPADERDALEKLCQDLTKPIRTVPSRRR